MWLFKKSLLEKLWKKIHPEPTQMKIALLHSINSMSKMVVIEFNLNTEHSFKLKFIKKTNSILFVLFVVLE